MIRARSPVAARSTDPPAAGDGDASSGVLETTPTVPLLSTENQMLEVTAAPPGAVEVNRSS